MKITLSLSSLKWPKDLFTYLCQSGLFSEENATVHVRGQFIGATPVVPVNAVMRNGAVLYQFDPPY